MIYVIYKKDLEKYILGDYCDAEFGDFIGATYYDDDYIDAKEHCKCLNEEI